VRLDVSGTDIDVLDMTGLPARSAGHGASRVLLLERNAPVFVSGKGPFELTRGTPPVTVTLPKASAHPGESIPVQVETGPNAKLSAAIPPLGWDGPAKTGDRPVSVRVPGHTSPGRYALTVVLEAHDAVFRLPVEVEVVPALLRK
jgi:hypothetical protein